MKNKKLFAILTLVCFMFTLMPMAAFAAPTTYAEIAEDFDYVDVNETIEIDIHNALKGSAAASTGSFYVFAINSASDRVYGDLFKPVTVSTDSAKVEFAIAKSGTYKMYVVDATERNQNVVKKYNDADLTSREAANLLIAASKVAMLANEVVVKSTDSDYILKVVKVDGKNVTKNAVDLAANNGYDEVEVVVQLNEATYDEDKEEYVPGDAVVGATLDVDTNSYVIDVDKAEVKTNAVGQAKFVVSASTAGNFKVYVEYGTKADLEIAVTSGALTPAAIATTAEPKAPVALDSALADAGVYFSITDANGNSVSKVKVDKQDMRADFAYKVVVDAPKGANIDKVNENGNGVVLTLTAKGWTLSGADLDEEGVYTFKVVLANGAYATAKVEVKEFQKPVALKLDYATNTVELGGKIAPDAVVYVDANGVEKAAKDAELSATGYAIKAFGEKTGEVTVKADEKYVGSTIKVIAVSEKYNLIDTAELVVANEAAAVKYATTNADVAVNNTLVANVVDMDGNKVALTGTLAKDASYQIQYIVLDKPEGAKVAVSTKSTADFMAKGQFLVSFTASAIGEYEVQTVVRVETDEKDETVVKYYSGVDTITVGNTGIEDVVVMSIGSNQIVKNDEVATMIAAPIVKDSRTFVPFRALSEAFGAEVAWDEATQTVTAELDGTTVVLTIGSAVYTVNGVAKTADVAPFIDGASTMVPVRFVAEAFGIKVTPTYDENGATADILFAK